MLAIGFVVSFIVAYASVAWFMAWVRKRGFVPFAIYRIAVGVLVLVFAARLASFQIVPPSVPPAVGRASCPPSVCRAIAAGNQLDTSANSVIVGRLRSWHNSMALADFGHQLVSASGGCQPRLMKYFSRYSPPPNNRRLNELIGFLLCVSALLLFLALASYSPLDPSLNSASVLTGRTRPATGSASSAQLSPI